MISDLRMKSREHWKKIVEKYGSGEKGTVLDFEDFRRVVSGFCNLQGAA